VIFAEMGFEKIKNSSLNVDAPFISPVRIPDPSQAPMTVVMMMMLRKKKNAVL